LKKPAFKSRIERLAGLKLPGTPAALASKFEISDRSVKRIIKEMREEGIEIRFDYNRMS